MTIKTMHFFLASSMNINYFYLFFEFGENGIEINLDNFEYHSSWFSMII